MSESKEKESKGCMSWVVLIGLILFVIGVCMPEGEPKKQDWECCCSTKAFGGYTKCNDYYNLTEEEAKERCYTKTVGVSCNLYGN